MHSTFVVFLEGPVNLLLKGGTEFASKTKHYIGSQVEFPYGIVKEKFYSLDVLIFYVKFIDFIYIANHLFSSLSF